MVRSILIALDASPSVQSAIDLGLRWAAEHDCLLVGLGVINEPHIRGPQATPVGGGYFKEEADEAELERARHHVDQILEQFTRRCTEAGVSFKLLEDQGNPAQQIMLESQRYDLIMLGSGCTFRKSSHNSPDQTLYEVVKHAPRPVVSVPETRGENGKSVVVAYDGSIQSAVAVQSLVAAGLAVNKPVHVVTAGGDRVQAAKVADRAIEYLRAHDLKAEPHIVQTTSQFAQKIGEKARELDAALMVMGAYGQGVVREFVFGSVTRRMLDHCDLPTFLCH